MTSTSGSPSTATDHLAHVRRSKKPLLEKKRRARINKSLEQLKALVLEALKKDTARYSKLEKADILEMTVKHLRDTQRHQLAVAMSVDPTVVGKFRSGYTECAQEVGRYLGTIDGLSGQTRDRLLQHLSRCSSNPEHVISYYTPGMSAAVPGLLATPVGHLPGYSGAGLGVSVPDNGYYGNLYGYQTFPREYPSPVNSEADSLFERSHSRASSRCSSPGGSTEPKVSLVDDYSEHYEARDNKLLSAQKAEFDNHRGSRDTLHAANQTVKIERKDFSASSLVCESQRLNNQVHSRKNKDGNFNIEVKQEAVWRPW